MACSFLADGVFFLRGLLSNKIKSTPPEKSALSTGWTANANHSARTAGIYFRAEAGGMRSKNAVVLVTKTRRRTINISQNLNNYVSDL